MGKGATWLSMSLDGFIAGPIELESTQVIEGAGVKHFTFRVVK